MNWKTYQNEIIVLAALLVMVFAYSYKHIQVSTQVTKAKESMHSLEELKEVVALKKVWANKKTSKKLDKLKGSVPASKVKWSKKSKKVTASFSDLSATELNKLTSQILNLPVIVRLLDIQKIGSKYNVEFKCKW